MSKPEVDQKSTSQPATAKDTAKQLLWFNISGSIGTVLFFIVYQLMFNLAPFDYHRASICWTASYLLSILWQHWLHRVLVFGTEGPYWSSLFWTYVTYLLSVAISAVLNDVLVEYLHVNHTIAWNITLGATGLLNYFTLRGSFAAPGQTKKQC